VLRQRMPLQFPTTPNHDNTLKLIQQSKWKILPNIWLLKRGRDSNIKGFGIIDIAVAVAIVIVIVTVEFGRVCGFARCLRTYSRPE